MKAEPPEAPPSAPHAAPHPAPAGDAERWAAWDRFVEAAPAGGFMQTSAWARFRARVGYEHFAVTVKNGDLLDGAMVDGEVVGGAVVGKWRRAPGRCFYYIQEGPLLPAEPALAKQVWQAVLESVERHRRREPERVSHLRIEPRWSAWPDFVGGFRAPPAPDGYTEPRHTLCIDLTLADEALLAQMKPKGRYNVRLAQRLGVAIVRDDSAAGLEDFIRIQRRTAVRQATDTKPPGYFRAMRTELVPPGPCTSIFFAEYRGRRIATALVVAFGGRATYFYGGSLVLHRHAMAPYLLHFDIMRWARAAGCRTYDFWGVAPPGAVDHPWRDLTAFKRKFGGAELTHVPAFDRVFDAAAYRLHHGGVVAHAEARKASGCRPPADARGATVRAPHD